MQRPPPHRGGPPGQQQKGKPKKKKSLVQQLRSLDRLLPRVTDSKQRAALEAQRAQLLQAQSEAETNRKERKLASRYHMVKFFGASRCSDCDGPLPAASSSHAAVLQSGSES